MAEVVLVSSGAVVLADIWDSSNVKSNSEQQAIAAIGQTELISIYKERFAIMNKNWPVVINTWYLLFI